MKRDELPLLQPQLSATSKRTAFGVLESIARSHEMTSTMEERIRSSYASTSDFLQESPEFKVWGPTIHGQGSRVIGTTVRPVGRAEFDIDSVMRLPRAAQAYYAQGGPVALLNTLEMVMRRYAEQHGLKLKRRARCVCLEYANEMHADLAPVFADPHLTLLFGEHHAQIPDRELVSYSDTNPTGYMHWFNVAASKRPMLRNQLTMDSRDLVRADVVPLPPQAEVFNRFLSRIVQVAKIHRNLYFKAAPDDAPTSVFLTTLLAKAYERQVQVWHDDELSFLLAVVRDMRRSIVELPGGDGTEWWVLNPTTRSENLAGRMNTEKRQTGFRVWHHALAADVMRLAESVELHEGRDSLVRKVGSAFSQDSADDLQRSMQRHLATDRSAGRAVVMGASGLAFDVKSRENTHHGDL